MKSSRKPPEIIYTPDWKDYALLDSGDGRKLEQFGKYTFVRPDSQAAWHPALPVAKWDAADAVFQISDDPNKGVWKFRKPVDDRWTMQYGDIRFWAVATPYRHLGVFPEQAAHWDWMRQLIETRIKDNPVRALNLFGYTGIASLIAAATGALVTHVDASKKAITWGKNNQTLSGLSERPIRWIVDDAVKFVQREGRRGVKYDVILMDPPPFGHGPKGEVWKFDKSLPLLLDSCQNILSEHPLLMIITAYTAQISLAGLHDAMKSMMTEYSGDSTAGTVHTVERSAGRELPMATFAHWQASMK